VDTYEYSYAVSGPDNHLGPINALTKDGWEVVVPMRPVTIRNKDTGEEAEALEFLMRRKRSVIATLQR